VGEDARCQVATDGAQVAHFAVAPEIGGSDDFAVFVHVQTDGQGDRFFHGSAPCEFTKPSCLGVKKMKPVIELWDGVGLGLIVEWPTGVFFQIRREALLAYILKQRASMFLCGTIAMSITG
jgi:hypothetical protein